MSSFSKHVRLFVLAGSVSGITSVAVRHLFDTTCQRLQVFPAHSRCFFHCIQRTVQRETTRGFQGVYKAIIFTTSSTLRNNVLPFIPLLQPVLIPTVLSLIAGEIDGGANAILVVNWRARTKSIANAA
ncbi:hypothetical protein CCR75_000173 [Bremia lactucae]|uniref:Uncharacterized protein n=1 Tax=Bremia lactucae TaxID=4779 RepID=A0A976FP95_BRELC|nr:hypothetical protein CCR75_000173 [Bremia lactucae]